MKRIGTTKMSRARNVISILRKIVDTLPSKSEKDEMNKALEALIEYLMKVQEDLKLLPDKDTVQDIVYIVNHLDLLLTKAENNPIVAKAIGLEKSPLKKTSIKKIDRGSEIERKEIMKEFESNTIDQIRELLENENRFPLVKLRSIANGLGLRFQARSARDTLVRIITSRIATSRGYNMLAEEARGEE